MPSRYSLLRGLHSATTPGKIPPPRFRSVGQTALWQKPDASRCCSAPRHLFGELAEARTRRHSSPHLSLPTPLKISEAVDRIGEGMLSRYYDAGYSAFGPPLPAHRRLANAPVRGSILRPNTAPKPSDAISPSAENAVQMLGEPYVLKSSRSLLHPPRCLPPGGLAQTGVLYHRSILKTVMGQPKSPKKPRSRKPGCCATAANSIPLSYSGIFSSRKLGCCRPARVSPDPA